MWIITLSLPAGVVDTLDLSIFTPCMHVNAVRVWLPTVYRSTVDSYAIVEVIRWDGQLVVHYIARKDYCYLDYFPPLSHLSVKERTSEQAPSPHRQCVYMCPHPSCSWLIHQPPNQPATPTMSKLFVTILKFLLPMIAQTVIIYCLLLTADWVTIYYLDPKNPLLIFAYLSLVHLITVPLLYVALNGNTKLYAPFAILNGLWIIITIILMFIIYFDARESPMIVFFSLSPRRFLLSLSLSPWRLYHLLCEALNVYIFLLLLPHAVGRWSLILWQGNPLHHILLLIFFIINVTAEVLAILQILQIRKSVSPDWPLEWLLLHFFPSLSHWISVNRDEMSQTPHVLLYSFSVSRSVMRSIFNHAEWYIHTFITN